MSRPPQVLAAGPRLEQRARQQRRRQRLVLARRAGWVGAAAAPFVLAAWLLLASPWLVVHRIVVVGEHRVTLAQVLAAVDVKVGTPLARVDTQGVAARVKGLGPVASVSVTRGWPSTLYVRVVERQPVAAVASGRAWTLLDGGGAELGTVAVLPAGLPVLTSPHPGPTDPATLAALAVLHELPSGLRPQVVGVGAATAEQVVLELTGRRTVVWGGVADGSAKAAAVTALLRLPGHVYDVSSPGVVTRR